MSDRIDTTTPIIARPDLESRLPPALRESRARAYTMGECRIIISRGEGIAHMSISTASRDPTWDEIASLRYRLLPHVGTMAMFLPPLAEYVNIHPFTFHLYEVRIQPMRNRS